MSERRFEKAIRRFYEEVTPPSPEELARNLQTLNKWLGMEELTTEELEERVRLRIEEQNLDFASARCRRKSYSRMAKIYKKTRLNIPYVT